MPAITRSTELTTVYHTETADPGDRDALFVKLMAASAAPLAALAKAGRITFTAVAKLENATLEDSFMLTNSINSPWYENEGVTKLFKGDGCRSTSVGDVVEEGGVYFVVTNVGFDCIDYDVGAAAKK